jgi:hypothetical protein
MARTGETFTGSLLGCPVQPHVSLLETSCASHRHHEPSVRPSLLRIMWRKREVGVALLVQTSGFCGLVFSWTSHTTRYPLPSKSPPVNDPFSTTLLRRGNLNHASALTLDLKMVLSGIGHGHIVAFPDAADVHVFGTTIASS